MGNYLNQPATDKICQTGERMGSKLVESDQGYTYACVSMQGWRRTMEDTAVAIKSLPQGESLFGIFDGHGGREVSQFCKEYLEGVLISQQSYKEKDYVTALTQSFIQLDERLATPEGQEEIVQIAREIIQEQKDNGNKEFAGGNVSDEKLRELVNNVGTTACVVLVTPDEIICANAGDSRCVLTQEMCTYDLSDDHKPDNEDEAMRIVEAGGEVESGRVNGKLGLSRAIGDLSYKRNQNLGPEEQIITCVPDVTTRKRSSKDSFLIVACDGIWDCLSSHECSKLIHEF